MILTRDHIRELLTCMFNGWRLHEASWDKDARKYTLDLTDAMTQAAGGDKMLGNLLDLFSYWSNDIQSVAAHYGIAINEDGSVRTDVPPPPTPEHYWHNNEWCPPFEQHMAKEIES